MNFLKMLETLVAPMVRWIAQQPGVKHAVQPIVSALQNVFSGSAGAAPSSPPTPPAASPIRMPTSIPQPLAKRKPDLPDIGTENSDNLPVAPDRRFRAPDISTEYGNNNSLAPIGATLRWHADEEAQRVIQMLQLHSGIVDAALRITPSTKAAFDFLWAEGTKLSSEELDEIIKQHGPGSISYEAHMARFSKVLGDTLQSDAQQSSDILFTIDDFNSDQFKGKDARGVDNQKQLSATVDLVNQTYQRYKKSASADELKRLEQMKVQSMKDGKVDIQTLSQKMSDFFGYKVKYGNPKEDPAQANELFGYWDVDADDTKLAPAQAGLLTLALLDSSLQQTAYWQERSGGGLNIFNQINQNNDHRLVIYLGADAKVNRGLAGYVQGKTPDAHYHREDAGNMYLGSDMAATGITHEFGHQVLYYLGSTVTIPEYAVESPGKPPKTAAITDPSMEGNVSDQVAELFPDYYRSDVYDTDPLQIDHRNPVSGNVVKFTDDKHGQDEKHFFEQFLVDKLYHKIFRNL